jgi:hypothetical protein
MILSSVGYSEKVKSNEAVLEAINQAKLDFGDNHVDVILIFTTSRHNPHIVHETLRANFNESTIISGGYAVGVITNKNLGYDGFQLGIMLLNLEGISFKVFYEKNLFESEYNKGLELGNLILKENDSISGQTNILLFYDSINRLSGKLQMMMATPLIEGFENALQNIDYQIAGAGLTGDMQFKETFQWCDNQILQHIIMAWGITGNIKMHTIILHGCLPASNYHLVTKADKNVILEIDGINALEFMQKFIGFDSDLTIEDYGWFITIGVNKSDDKWGEFNSDNYANRMCVNIDKKRGGLVMVETDIVSGTEIQFMRRSVNFNYISKIIQNNLIQIESQNQVPKFAIYIDCAGRAGYYFGSDIEEATEVQKSLGNIPLLGFYTGVEIAKVNNKISPLDWTGVLCVFSE